MVSVENLGNPASASTTTKIRCFAAYVESIDPASPPSAEPGENPEITPPGPSRAVDPAGRPHGGKPLATPSRPSPKPNAAKRPRTTPPAVCGGFHMARADRAHETSHQATNGARHNAAIVGCRARDIQDLPAEISALRRERRRRTASGVNSAECGGRQIFLTRLKKPKPGIVEIGADRVGAPRPNIRAAAGSETPAAPGSVAGNAAERNGSRHTRTRSRGVRFAPCRAHEFEENKTIALVAGR